MGSDSDIKSQASDLVSGPETVVSREKIRYATYCTHIEREYRLA